MEVMMVAVWMLYATIVGLFVMAAASALEAPQRKRGRARWVWATSFLLALTLPLLRGPLASWGNALVAGIIRSTETGLADLGGIEIIGAPAVAAALAPWDAVLLIGWVAASAVSDTSTSTDWRKTRRCCPRV
jgi:hypothetical protein